MIQYTRLMNALKAGQELPVLTLTEYTTLIEEITAMTTLSEFDKKEMLENGRFYGHGFAVDYNKE